MSDKASTLASLCQHPDLLPLRRSLEVYYGDAKRAAAMDALYARFVRPGDIAFDIGAHVGDRIGSFRRLGAHVVRARHPRHLRRRRRGHAGGGRLRGARRHRRAQDKLCQPDRFHCLRRVRRRRRRCRRLGRPGLG
jgi:hypothetical protein